MKNKKKLLYSFAVAGAVSIPVVGILSCGENTSGDQSKMNGITSDMVKTAFAIAPDQNTLPSTINKSADKTAILNGLGGVKMSIRTWMPSDDKGEITVEIEVSKSSLKPPSASPFPFTLTGYMIDEQSKMDGITSDMVKDAWAITVDPANLADTITQPDDKPATLNNLDDVQMTITKWNPDNDQGKITAGVEVYKPGLTAPSGSPFTITWSGFVTTDQKKMNDITSDMIKTAIGISPSSIALASSASRPTDGPITLNTLDSVQMTITDWKVDNDKGEIVAIIAISKTGLTSPPNSFTITWNGYMTGDQGKMNGITSVMVSNAIGIPTARDVLADTINQPSDKPATLNTLDGVQMTITEWKSDNDQGEITAKVAISKTGLTPPTGPTGSPFAITWSGFVTTDQNKMNGITSDMVKDAWAITVDPANLPTPIAQPNNKTATLNGLDDVQMTINSWSVENTKGSITAEVAISKTGLTTPANPFTIVWCGFLSTGYTWTNEAVAGTGPFIGVSSSMILVDANTMLMGTKHKEFYKVDISAPVWTWTQESVSDLTDKSGDHFSISQAGTNKLLVGTLDKGFYKVDTTDNAAWTWTKESSVPDFDNGSGSGSSITKVDNDTYLIGTSNNGFWKVDISDLTTLVFTKETTNFKNAGAGQYSSVAQVDTNIMLVGTHDNGHWTVDTSSAAAWVWVKAATPASFTESSGQYGSILKIDTNKNKFFVGTQNKGFWQLDTSSPAWVWGSDNASGLPSDSAWASTTIKISTDLMFVATGTSGLWKVEI